MNGFPPFQFLLLSLFGSLLIWACGPSTHSESNFEDFQTEAGMPVYVDTVQRDLLEVKKEGVLTAITIYSSTSYFIYKGQPMGYEYELLERLADYLDLELEIVIANDLDSLTAMLYRGEGDLIAYGLTVTKPRQQNLDFTLRHNYTRQVLVQRKPPNWRKMKLHEIEKKLIRNPVDLIGDTVHVRKNSSYYQRLQNLSEEMGGDIIVEPLPGNFTTDEIIAMVNDGKIKFTVADQNIALINQTYYPDLDVETAVSFPQRISWAVRKGSPKLLNAINSWILEMRKSTDYYVIYNKYFKNRKDFTKRVNSEYFSKTGGKISPYDELFQKYAQQLKWDWRLLASQAYQESQFDPKTRSWAGARGLLQVLPSTAQAYGIKNLYDPESNLKAAARHLQMLTDSWQEIPDSLQRIKFILASYNAGLGHVQDAQRLAEKMGRPAQNWDGGVDSCMLLKAEERYFSDPVVQFGYCRGEEPFQYVKEIFKRYEQYCNFIPEMAQASR